MQMRSRYLAMGLTFQGRASTLAACGADALTSNPTTQIQPSDRPQENGIIDGKASGIRDFPATGVILFTSKKSTGEEFGSMLCSGTLVAPDVVMAAGHCNLALFVGTRRPIKYYFSFALDVSEFGRDSVELPPQTYEIAALMAHPDFNIRRVELGLGKAKDLALFFLKRRVKDVTPARVIHSDEVSSVVKGAEVSIVGYGRRSERQSEDPTDAGIKYQGVTAINLVGPFEMQISTGSPEPHKCHGDSGGPTYLTLRDGTVVMVGVTSHAYDRQDCRHGGVDTRIDPLLTWVKQAMEDTCISGDRPACPKGRDRNLQ
jgi:hypothetical protein